MKEFRAKLYDLVPFELRNIENPQRVLPTIAKNEILMSRIEQSLRQVPTTHRLYLQDSRTLKLPPESVHLVVTSPPYWTLKSYNMHDAQLGNVQDYDQFLRDLDKIWRRCFKALVPGGRLVCIVGDVCLSRRNNTGEHTVVPLHASIQEHCRKIGFTNLAPIIWHKIANANYEVSNSSTFFGKPYEPNAVIKNDIEFILMERKGGGYRKPNFEERVLSLISAENYQLWFRQIWHDITGASTKSHPAPFPLVLAERLIRMFSFVGDTILDPFLGTGTTSVAAGNCGRNSIGVEVDPEYFHMARNRIGAETTDLFIDSVAVTK
ncbi:MAG: site-specific DNA-methyltransferase [Gammaproteobacteria bacterium]|nr:site-specific DNA-methyltransferase [Gammaproteobacteria bacterium]MDE0252938.1 site-specific DNA-methyltransferase [Gammaproteobacteria bacterium]MDE0402049.1 site-specific DNA-methyltransferase [Gammaproteobacteria bacterium]